MAAAAQPIFDAIDAGSLAEVQRLVEANPAVLEERLRDGTPLILNGTPLMKAITWRRLAIALWLIAHRGEHDLSTGDGLGHDAMYYACTFGPQAVVRALVEVGAGPGRIYSGGETTLHLAALHGNGDVMVYLLKLHDLSTLTNRGWDALWFACERGQLSVVQALLEAGADTGAAVPDEGTLLHVAYSKGHDDVVAYLLTLPAVRAGIDVENEDGFTVLGKACWDKNVRCTKLLLEAGADPTRASKHYSPWVLATRSEHLREEMAALLNPALDLWRARLLSKARAILDTTHSKRKAEADFSSLGRTRGLAQQRVLAAAVPYLRGRVERGEMLPRVKLLGGRMGGDEQQQQQGGGGGGGGSKRRPLGKRREECVAVLTYVLGMDDAFYLGDSPGMAHEVFVELLDFMARRG